MKEEYFWIILTFCSLFCSIIFTISIFLEPTNKYNWLCTLAWISIGIVSFSNYKVIKNDDF